MPQSEPLPSRWMKMARAGAIFLVAGLAGCAGVQQEPAQIAYGKVLSVQYRQEIRQEPNLTGAVVGGVAGGVVGHQFGKGNGKTAMTVLGAVAGAAVGSQYNKKEEVRPVADLVVQMADGKAFTITTADVGFRPGQPVRIIQQGRTATIEAIDDGARVIH
jgi:outer membrane lipoprotein SlyB